MLFNLWTFSPEWFSSSQAEIKCKLYLPHPIGIVINEGVIIGNNVTKYQNVTIGIAHKKEDDPAYLKIDDNVKIYAGSVSVGGITIGNNSPISTLSFIDKNIPDNCTVLTKKTININENC